MSTARSTTPLLALAAILCIAASSADSRSVRAELQKQYDVAAAAFLRRDVAGIMKVTSPDLTSRRPDGHVWNRKQLQVYMNLTVGALKTIDSARFRVRKIESRDGEVVALVDHTVSGILGDASGKPRRIVDVSTDRDIWVKTPDGWRLKFTECVKEKVTLDGKPVRPSPALAAH